MVRRLEAVAGIRYCEETRDSTNIVSQVGAPIGVVDTIDNDKVALRFVLKYRFSDDLMAYASYSDGFRSGGIQFFDLELFGVGENTFDPEELTTWEIGAKGTFGEGKLDFEFAAFLTKYRNVQVYAPNPLGLQAFNNGGRAEVEGIEVAATLNARVGWTFENWSLYVFGENLTNEEQQLGVPTATLLEYVLQ